MIHPQYQIHGVARNNGKFFAQKNDLSSGRQTNVDLGQIVGEYILDLPEPRSTHSTSSVLNLSLQKLSWEILPLGWWREGESNSHSSITTPVVTPDELERILFLDSFSPQQWVSGSIVGQRLYYVACFSNVVIAESP